MMKPAKRTLAAGLALVLVVGVLAGLVYWTNAPAPTAVLFLAPPNSPNSPNRQLEGAETYSSIAERPIFVATRRPAPPPLPKPEPVVAAPPPPPPPTLPQITLLAIVLSPQRHEAVFTLSNGSNATLAEGDQLEGWTLEKILPDKVVFRFDDTVKEVDFPSAGAGQAKRPFSVRPIYPPPAVTPPPLR
jgi:hypothetical protein